MTDWPDIIAKASIWRDRPPSGRFILHWLPHGDAAQVARQAQKRCGDNAEPLVELGKGHSGTRCAKPGHAAMKSA
jgi:hypothetical protein